MKFPNLPFVVITSAPFEPRTFEDRIDQIPGRKISRSMAADLDEMIANVEHYPIGSIYFQKLIGYRRQCCESDIHRFGDWTPGAFVPRRDSEAGLRATMEHRKCVYCDLGEYRPVFEPAPIPAPTHPDYF